MWCPWACRCCLTCTAWTVCPHSPVTLVHSCCSLHSWPAITGKYYLCVRTGENHLHVVKFLGMTKLNIPRNCVWFIQRLSLQKGHKHNYNNGKKSLKTIMRMVNWIGRLTAGQPDIRIKTCQYINPVLFIHHHHHHQCLWHALEHRLHTSHPNMSQPLMLSPGVTHPLCFCLQVTTVGVSQAASLSLPWE